MALIYRTLSTQVTQPLAQLLQSTQQLTEGKFQCTNASPEAGRNRATVECVYPDVKTSFKNLVATLEDRVAQRTFELEAANQELQRLSNLDSLTQIANRRHFDQYLDQEWLRLRREQEPLGLILCDVDFFKTVQRLLRPPRWEINAYSEWRSKSSSQLLGLPIWSLATVARNLP